ncbi:uncharacterized protein LOC128347301 isoform X6 [Hemicordylus capensis]|uniref:uncharacterized protein LOC128347301 isoform X6 n=1 Tax=Hemicordylus capensis TaxID=884348 RepID=UPI002302AF56|nr:uncharacterized protein LOC128347301 isoform X6 [Hemicordylus capensis]XP_053157721.1 uncharacterized protein LOC128347301 isoform X6 [Hemicordylus capensis]
MYSMVIVTNLLQYCSFRKMILQAVWPENLKIQLFLPHGCKWSCLQEGFENIRKNCKKPCSKCGQELEKVIERQQKISRSPKCQSIRCLETCKHSNTGTIIEFLNETKNALQIINRNEIQRMN